MPLELIVLSLLVGALLALVLARAWRRFVLRRRFRRAREGEREAEQLLERAGYRILDAQVRQRGELLVDGERVAYEVRADLLATRRGRTYVVEVKTGSRAPKPSSAATRRQLREYADVYEVDGLLLADMQAGRLYAIEFPRRPPPPRRSFVLPMLLLGLLVGVALGVWLAGLGD
jgi:Holliday junction resolvase-like predicted endonuclease